MSTPNDPAESGNTDIAAYLRHQHETGLLRFITCGSVDDGKSTLIGRLLWDSKLIYEDQLAALTADSKRVGTQQGGIDYALLLDGLEAEREQGITIDVAYRFFSTDRRKFIVADTPGHEQYTRNMVTGASNAEAAVILVDAAAVSREGGLLAQTKRHSYLVSLVGIRHVVLAVNKMDLVGYDEALFREITDAYRAFSAPLGFPDIRAIPVSALRGDNVMERSANMPWYKGPTLLDYLETVDVEDARAQLPFRFPVQLVQRPDSAFRGFAGTVASGAVRPGDEVAVAASGEKANIDRIVTMSGDLDVAVAGDAVTLTLSREIDVSRGDVLAAPQARPSIADQFKAHLVWLHAEPLLPGRMYPLKSGTDTAPAQVTELKARVNINTLAEEAAKTLEMNEVGLANLALGKDIAFDPFSENAATGNFILIDRETNATVAAGMIQHALRRATNIHWQAVTVNKAARAQNMAQRPRCVWFTGLSGSGKSTIADIVEKRLHAMGRKTYLLDGDNVRHGLCRDLGFTDADRVENIRRIAEAARLMVDAGLIVICSFISPFRAERKLARSLMEDGEFLEVFVDTPLSVCEARDPKGLYRRARAGELPNFTGIDSPYEAPEGPELRIDGAAMTPEEAAERVLELILR